MKQQYKRILVSPIIFIIQQSAIIAGLLFFTSIIMLISFVLLLQYPFTYILNLGREKFTYDESFIEYSEKQWINHLLGVSILLWYGVYWTYRWIKNGDLGPIGEE